MEIYRLYSQTNDEQAICDRNEYLTFSDAEAALKKMIAEQGSRMNVNSYISAVRSGNNESYREAAADCLANIFSESDAFSVEKIKNMSEMIEDFNLDCYFGDAYPIEDFRAVTVGDIIIIDFFFDKLLHLEFDVNTDAEDGSIIKSYFYMQDDSVEYRVSIEEDVRFDVSSRESNSINLMLVYQALVLEAKKQKHNIERFNISPNELLHGITPEQMRKNFRTVMGEGFDLTTETIVKHVNTLKKLGIPIKHYRISRAEKEFWEARHIGYNEGYEIDLEVCNDIPDPIDASGLGVGVNPLLILFVLMSSDKPMKQADIISAIKEKYNVSIARAAVGRHIGNLKKLGYFIKNSRCGCVLEKEGE